MKLKEVRVMAKSAGIKKISSMTKVGLIHAIQLDEGNFNCYATATLNKCDQVSCLWRADCFTAAKK